MPEVCQCLFTYHSKRVNAREGKDALDKQDT